MKAFTAGILTNLLRHRDTDNQKQEAQRHEPESVEPPLSEANAGNHAPLLGNPFAEPNTVISMG